jgi:hypothetical protein
MNIQPPRPIPSPILLSEWISASLSLKKAQRSRESRHGDRDDDERRRGAKQQTTLCTWDQGEPEREAVEDHVWFEDRWMVASLCDE